MTHPVLVELRAHPCKLLVLLGFLAFHLLVSTVWVAPGHLTIDEGVYDLMVRTLLSRGELTVWNGYQEFASPELALPALVAREGQLVPQYPSLYPLLAAPVYWLLGFRALFLLNAVAFAATLGLCFLVARRLFRDTALALNACLIFALATFAWEYSQAAWPHALSMCLVALAVYCALRALQSSAEGAAAGWSVLAGAVLAIGIGVRLDTVFAVPALLLPFLFARPWRPKPAVLVCLGLVPGLVGLSAMNLVKFGTLSPFSYGLSDGHGNVGGVSKYLPIAFAGSVFLVGAWMATTPLGCRVFRCHRDKVLIGLFGALLLALATAPGWAMASRLADGAAQLLVDLRLRDAGIAETALARGPSGGMIYLASLKKSLLQSAPYLVALALPLLALLRGRDRPALGLLFLVPAGYIAVFSYFAWHGGLAFNQRYLLPTLPFLAILTAYAWRDLAPALRRGLPRVAIALSVAAFALHFLTAFPTPAPMAVQEFVFLALPLAIAFVLGGLLLLWRFATAGRSGVYAGAASVAMVVAMVWGGLVSLTYDFPRSYFIRAARAGFSESVGPLIARDSILFAPYGDQFFGLIERGDVRFARPGQDDYATFRPLVDFHLDAGRSVYLWRTPEVAEVLQERPLLQGLTATPLYRDRSGELLQLGRGQEARRRAGAAEIPPRRRPTVDASGPGGARDEHGKR